MVKLTVYNRLTRIECTEEEASLIKEALMITHRMYTKKDGWVVLTKHYFKKSGQMIPTGLSKRVYDLFPKDQVEIYDGRDLDFEKIEIGYSGHTPREHQEEAVQNCLKVKRGIIDHATGAGKTVTFAYLISKIGHRAIVIVPNRLLLNQTHKVLADSLTGCTVGKAGDGNFEIEADVLVTTAAMLYSRMEKLPPDFFSKRFGTMIFDECHHLNEHAHAFGYEGNTWYDIGMRFDCPYRFAFSGTVPEDRTLHRFAVESVAGRVLHIMTPQDCMEEGVISEAEIIMHQLPRIGVKTFWPDALDTFIVGRRDRNELITRLACDYREQGKSVLVFVSRIAHGNELQRLIPNSVFVQGMDTTEQRQTAVDALSKKDRIVIGTIFGEGFDLPNLDVAINASGGKALIRIVQQVGRVLRKKEGKDVGTLVDFLDLDLNGVLTRHSMFRRRAYERYFGVVTVA